MSHYDNWKAEEPESQNFSYAVLVNNQDQELEVEYDLLPEGVHRAMQDMLKRYPDYTVQVFDQITNKFQTSLRR